MKIKNNVKDVFAIFETTGRLKAAIDIASFRQVSDCCIPNIDVDVNAKAKLQISSVKHHLMDSCVSNSLDTDKSILITGANATGKSTFLKTTFINVVLSQSICTCVAKEYNTTYFNVFTSMALSDDLYIELCHILQNYMESCHFEDKIENN